MLEGEVSAQTAQIKKLLMVTEKGFAALPRDVRDEFSNDVAALDWVIVNFAWLFIIAGNIFVVLAVYIAVSRYGNTKLAKSAEEEPEFGTLPWISMMFAAGMGIGLMFYGVAEPLAHYFEAPPPLELDPASPF